MSSQDRSANIFWRSASDMLRSAYEYRQKCNSIHFRITSITILCHDNLIIVRYYHFTACPQLLQYRSLGFISILQLGH